jgi:hypothetical protein
MFTRVCLCCLLQCFLVAEVATAQETNEQAMSDPAVEAEAANEEDAATEKDPGRGRFLALPFVVTEPAIGEGLGAGVIYFHRKPDSEPPRITNGKNLKKTTKQGKRPPTATGLFGMYTNTETYAYGIGHSGTSPSDKYRYIGAAAAMQVNATVYENDIPFKFSMDGTVFYANGKRRWRDTNVFFGASMSYLDSTTDFELDGVQIPPMNATDISSTDVGVALSGIYDGRDDTMMPNTGQLYDLTVWRYGENLGGDFNYTTARFKFNTFHRLAEKFVLGFRFEVGTANGDVPYYAEPFVPLRGIPALRYTGDSAGVVEVEGRYDIAKRWSVVAFIGSGFVDETETNQTEDDIYGYGAGIRFQALKEQNIWLGIDLAQGPEDKAWYVQMGHPW